MGATEDFDMTRISNAVKWLAPLVLLTVGGCAAAPFRADVSRFQTQLPAPQGQTFAVKAADAANDGGIEFSQYAGLVAAEMQKLGYSPVAPGSKADLTVKLGYAVDQGKERTAVRSDPFYDPFWGYGGFNRGYYSRPYVARGRGGHLRYVNGWYDPFLFGGYGYNGFDMQNYTVFTSGIDVKIEKTATGERVFEGKAEAKSRSNRLPYLVPNLVAAMFTDFPGSSGETVRISVAPEPKAK
jgi:Domain of unknown function (DUF4136)